MNDEGSRTRDDRPPGADWSALRSTFVSSKINSRSVFIRLSSDYLWRFWRGARAWRNTDARTREHWLLIADTETTQVSLVVVLLESRLRPLTIPGCSSARVCCSVVRRPSPIPFRRAAPRGIRRFLSLNSTWTESIRQNSWKPLNWTESTSI